MTIGTAVLEHLAAASVFHKGHIVYCVEAHPCWERVTLPVSEAQDALTALPRDAMERFCLSALRAVRDHPGVDPGSLGGGRMGYAPICDTLWLGYVDSSTELLYLVMTRTSEELERRSARGTLIMSPFRLVGNPMAAPRTFPFASSDHPLLTIPVSAL